MGKTDWLSVYCTSFVVSLTVAVGCSVLVLHRYHNSTSSEEIYKINDYSSKVINIVRMRVNRSMNVGHSMRTINTNTACTYRLSCTPK